MRSEKAKMLAGEPFNPLDSTLVNEREAARDLCRELNFAREGDVDTRRRVLSQLFASGGETVWMQPPFYCDYGSNIYLGKNVYFNFNCVVLDVCEVRIGDHVFFGPAVQIYTGSHPINPMMRRDEEFGKPITIGSDVWIGGAAVLCPGIEIGSESVIGAGSVVTKDIPSGVVAVGNPCRVLRKLTEKELTGKR